MLARRRGIVRIGSGELEWDHFVWFQFLTRSYLGVLRLYLTMHSRARAYHPHGNIDPQFVSQDCPSSSHRDHSWVVLRSHLRSTAVAHSYPYTRALHQRVSRYQLRISVFTDHETRSQIWVDRCRYWLVHRWAVWSTSPDSETQNTPYSRVGVHPRYWSLRALGDPVGWGQARVHSRCSISRSSR